MKIHPIRLVLLSLVTLFCITACEEEMSTPAPKKTPAVQPKTPKPQQSPTAYAQIIYPKVTEAEIQAENTGNRDLLLRYLKILQARQQRDPNPATKLQIQISEQSLAGYERRLGMIGAAKTSAEMMLSTEFPDPERDRLRLLCQNEIAKLRMGQLPH